jgi:hypothetical protein
MQVKALSHIRITLQCHYVLSKNNFEMAHSSKCCLSSMEVHYSYHYSLQLKTDFTIWQTYLILTLFFLNYHFRFGQRCSEAKVTVHANAEISLADQIKALNVHIKQLEKRINVLEGEKTAIAAELTTSKEYWRQVWEPRTLSSLEKVNCKLCVQNLFASAKESLAMHSSAAVEEPSSPNKLAAVHPSPGAISTDRKESLSTEVENNTKVESINADNLTVGTTTETESLIERSREDLYLAVEKMDRAVLIELSIALGGLVQTMYLEREKAKAEDHRRLMRKSKILAEKEARLKAKFDQEEEEKVRLYVLSIDVLYENLLGRHCS